jgi:glycosyltransferase involved in cell wall biosynthesis
VRVTILCPHLRIAGGVRAILAYADRLAARGHDVEVVVPEGRGRRRLWRPAPAPSGPAWLPRFRARVRRVARWSAPDLREADALVATAWESATPVAEAPRACGAKVYLVQHYESLYHGDAAAVDATYRLPLTLIVISTWLRDVLRERFGREAEILVTPVDRELFHPVPAARTPSGPRVLMLHHEYPWKGVADGLAAAARVRASAAGLRLVGFGVTPPRERAPYDEFHANPPQAALAALYSSADVYLCPSWDEGLGMPSMEAMACGAALVTYDNGGCRDYARHGETALVARRRDVVDLARQLEVMLTDAALRESIAARGRAFVTSAFDWDRAVDRMEALLAAAPR